MTQRKFLHGVYVGKNTQTTGGGIYRAIISNGDGTSEFEGGVTYVALNVFMPGPWRCTRRSFMGWAGQQVNWKDVDSSIGIK